MQELKINNISSQEQIKNLLAQTQRAQYDLLESISSQRKPTFKLYKKYGQSTQNQLKNPLLIKKLEAPQKSFNIIKEVLHKSQAHNVLKIPSSHRQAHTSKSQSRIHSKCPAIKPKRVESAFRSFTQCQPLNYKKELLVPKSSLQTIHQQNGKQQNFVRQSYTPKQKVVLKTLNSKTEWDIGRWAINEESRLYTFE